MFSYLSAYGPKPTPWVPAAAGGRYPAIIPKAYYEKVGAEAFGSVEKLVTCGEFKPVEHKRLQHFIMEANEDFFDPERVPRVKRIKLAVVPELSTRLAMLQTGEADIIGEINGPAVPQIRANPEFKVAASKMTACYYLAAADLIHPDPSPVKDKRVREALALAIDVDSIVKKIYFGEADPAVGFMYDYDAGYDPTIEPRGYDFEKAKKLLAEAGYADGFEVDLQGALTPSTPRCDKVLEAVASFWEKLGIKVNLSVMEAGTYYAKYREKTYRGFCAMSAPAIYDSLVTMWYMAYSDMMYSYYSNPQMDEWLNAQKTELDPTKRAEIGRKIWHHWYDELVGINVIHPRALYGMGPKIADWKTLPHEPYTVGLEFVVPAD
jgi:peptide/nickel transport system substrate-binding protein